MVRLQVSKQITAAAMDAHLHEDLGWTPQRIEQDFDAFLGNLHDHLHELARTAIPLGLHTFGMAASREHRVSTVMQTLGHTLYEALGVAGYGFRSVEWCVGEEFVRTGRFRLLPYYYK